MSPKKRANRRLWWRGINTIAKRVVASIFVVRANRVIGRRSPPTDSSLIKSSLVVAASPVRDVPRFHLPEAKHLPLSTNENGIEPYERPGQERPVGEKKSESARRWSRIEREANRSVQKKGKKGWWFGRRATERGPNQHANAPIRHAAKRLRQIKLCQPLA